MESGSGDSDAIVVGAGLIGLALARELHRHGLRVRIFDADMAGHGASWAGAGMLAGHQLAHPALRRLGVASGRLYRTWAPELEREVGMKVGYRPSGTLYLTTNDRPLPKVDLDGWVRCGSAEVQPREPELQLGGSAAAVETWRIDADHSIDNRLLGQALVAAVRARGIELREGDRVEAIQAPAEPGGKLTVIAGGERFHAPVVINAAGAWSGQIEAPYSIPVRPRKGQMIRLRSEVALRYVIEAPGVYLVPRGGGRVLVGATLEDVGFDGEVSPDTARELQRRAAKWVPKLADAELEETWIGYRPCSSDSMPILGPTHCPGYWLATAHFRDGILLTPITAKMIAKAVVTGRMTTALDWTPFLPQRFAC